MFRLTTASVLLSALLVSSTVGQGTQIASSQSSAVDSSGKRFTQREIPKGTQPAWLKDATKKVGPEYPYQDRAHHRTGSGLFRMEIDLKTGSVQKVTMIKSTGYDSLNEAATKALSKWRFRPNTWKEVTFPVQFTMASSMDGTGRPGANSIPLVPDRGGRP